MFGWWLKDDQRSVASQGYLCVYEVYPLVGYWDAIEKERERSVNLRRDVDLRTNQ
jgi:hypothetical protein